jgi:quercetin dioxygenase-like cupin family protein
MLPLRTGPGPTPDGGQIDQPFEGESHMKRSTRFLLVVSGSLALLLVAWMAFAQDAVKVAPKNFKVLLENERVRVLEYQSKTGEKIALHSHPPNVVYALGPGHVRFTLPDGKTKELILKGGEAVWSDGGPHTQESITDAHVIQIEIKR